MSSIVPKSTLRRQTHAICRNCFQVLQEYSEVQCDRCLIKLDDSRVSYDVHDPLPLTQKVYCFFESFYNRFLQVCSAKRSGSRVFSRGT